MFEEYYTVIHILSFSVFQNLGSNF